MLNPFQQPEVLCIPDYYNSVALFHTVFSPLLVTTWKLLTTCITFIKYFFSRLFSIAPAVFQYSNFCLSKEEGNKFRICHTDKHCNNRVLLIIAVFL